MRRTYLFRFEAAPPAVLEELEGPFYAHFCGLVSEVAGRVVLSVHAEVGEAGAVAAAMTAVAEVEARTGARVRGLDRDLVDVDAIAWRAGLSRERVRELVAGREGGPVLPAPCGVVSGWRVWEWGAVNGWLREHLPQAAEPEWHLSRREAAVVDGMLAAREAGPD